MIDYFATRHCPVALCSLLLTLRDRKRGPVVTRFMALVGVIVSTTLAVFAASDKDVRLNQVQVIGSHNSYHAGLGPNEMAFLRQKSAKDAGHLDYSHPPLKEQLDHGIRQLEIDVFADSKGGLYADPAWPKMMKQAGLAPDPDFDPKKIMAQPGFKVLHVQDLDYRSRCEPFVECLQEVYDWSTSHPGHLPLFILVETKDGDKHPEWMMTPEPFTKSTFDELDRVVRSVFREDHLIMPDKVRGRFKTLEEAVLGGNWPTLQEAKGKVLFLLDQKKVGPVYREGGHQSLEGRVFFTNSTPGSPDAAFIEFNEPIGNEDTIRDLAKKGYLIRTRTDADTAEARTGDIQRRETAMRSGAQILSTDYAFGEMYPATSYSVSFSNGHIARCNPVTATRACSVQMLEPSPPQGLSASSH